MGSRAPRRRWRCACRRCLTGAALLTAPCVAAAQSADQIAYGEHLASSCAPCHRVGTAYQGGNFAGTARIVGLAPDIFLDKLRRQEESGDPLMQQIAAELTEEERAALAAYLSLQSDQ